MNTRQHDLEQLRQDYKKERDPNIRRQIDDAGKRIAKEGKTIGGMREALVREHRRGKKGQDNIKDIHDIVEKKKKYRHHKKGY